MVVLCTDVMPQQIHILLFIHLVLGKAVTVREFETFLACIDDLPRDHHSDILNRRTSTLDRHSQDDAAPTLLAFAFIACNR